MNKIIIDTREQKPLFRKNAKKYIYRKLDEGDYTLEGFEDKFTIERKSPCDLYGSIIQGHKRFRKEILRAQQKNKEFIILVECNKQDFIGLNWPGGFTRKMKPRTLAAIINTLEHKYNIEIIWSENRKQARIDLNNRLLELYIKYKMEVNSICQKQT